MQQVQQSARLFRRGDVVVLSAVLLLSVIFFLIASGIFSLSHTAVEKKCISIQTDDGTKLFSCEKEEKTVSVVCNDLSLNIVIDKEGAAVSDSNCPDQICVHSGKITKIGASIVCVPAHCVISVIACPDTEGHSSSESTEYQEGVDAIVG